MTARATTIVGAVCCAIGAFCYAYIVLAVGLAP